MAGYSKLFSDIVTSSVWVIDNATLRVWIAMLATCDASGFVPGAIPGFASLARVSIPEMEQAVQILAGPDPYSRNKANEGRRIAETRGGWLILNYPEYRNRKQCKDGSRAEYERNRRAGKKGDADA